jgi:hypothetical protein
MKSGIIRGIRKGSSRLYIQTRAIYLPIEYPVAAMCSIVQDAIKRFEDNEEKEKLASDALNIMLELAEHQKNAFYLKSRTQKLMPKQAIRSH